MQRDASRARVLEAARDLFLEHGFEATTVRMIAERAGLSPAGVFTTFSDKRDILHHVRMAQNAALREALAEAADRIDAPTADAVCALLRLAYAREWPHLPLVIAYIGASYGWSAETEAAMQADHRELFDALRRMIDRGRTSGELHESVDPAVTVELLYGVYQGNFRNAWTQGWTAEQTSDHVERKIRMIFRGLERR